MKLYYHPISTTSRTIMLFAAESRHPAGDAGGRPVHRRAHAAAVRALNPNKLIPTLEDGDFVLTENSAILKYLADKIDSPAYPKDLQQRARVNERMDWTSTQLCSDLVYGWSTRRSSTATSAAATRPRPPRWSAAKERAQTWLKVLNEHVLGAGQQLPVRRRASRSPTTTPCRTWRWPR